ncbi:MAG: hypothetical protein ACR2LJ_08215 [Acidimicrobiales bacterium]
MTNATTIVTRRPIEATRPDGMGGDEFRGRSTGVIVGAVMGVVWAGSTLGALDLAVTVPVLVAGAAVCAALMAGARRMRRAAAALPATLSAAVDLGRVRSRFGLVVAGEFAAIAVAVNVLGRSGHPRWIPAVICAVVGLHFVPLARLFKVRVYDATAVALCGVAAATMIMGVAGAPVALWRLLPGFGAALALWATSARMLFTARTEAS